MERISKLFDIVAHSPLFKSRCDDRKPIRQALVFPKLPQPFADAAEAVPEAEVIRIAVIIPDSGAAINAKFWNRAVPGEADDMAWLGEARMFVVGIPRVRPACGELLVGRFRFGCHLLKNPPPLPRAQTSLIILESHRMG